MASIKTSSSSAVSLKKSKGEIFYRNAKQVTRPLTMSAMFSSQLQPIFDDGEGKLDVSSIGRTNILHSEEERRNVLLTAESLLQSRTADGDLRRREKNDSRWGFAVILAQNLTRGL